MLRTHRRGPVREAVLLSEDVFRVYEVEKSEM